MAAARKRRGPLAFVGAVAGISLLTPYVVSSAAAKWPNSVIAKFNNQLHKGTS